MKTKFLLIFLSMLFLNTSNAVFAGGSKKSSKSKSTYVKGYTKKDGTYVKPHYRK